MYARVSSSEAPHEGQAVSCDPCRLAPHTAHAPTGLRLMNDAVLMLSPPGLGQTKRASPLRLTLYLLRLPVPQNCAEACLLSGDTGQPVL